MGNEPSERDWLEGLDPMTEQRRRDEFYEDEDEDRYVYDPETASDRERAAYEAGQLAALTEAAEDATQLSQAPRGTPEFDLWISDMTDLDIEKWLRARAAGLGGATHE